MSNAANWDFTATTADELARIGESQFTASKQKYLDEQVQMTRLLEALSCGCFVQFPVGVRHAGKKEVPDFQLRFGERRIAVELAKSAMQDVEHARSLQQRGLERGTLAVSALWCQQSTPRTKDEVVVKAFSSTEMVSGLSLDDYHQLWLQMMTTQLDEKTAVLAREGFQHGDEDWLALWDRVGMPDFALFERLDTLRDVLASRWRPGWYSRLFVQDEHFRWLATFTSTGYVLFYSRSAAA